MAGKKTFTWQELSDLNQEENAHVAVRGKVYDVSSFVKYHPGGREALLMAAGRDVTMIFESYHAFSSTAPRILEKYYVGDLISNEFPTFPEPGPFHRTARARVWKYFKDTKQDPKYSGPGTIGRVLLFPILITLLWIAQLCLVSHRFFLACLAAAFLGWFHALMAMISVHDGSHFAITSNPRVWKAVLCLCHDFLSGASHLVWIYQHVFGHHIYTNIDHADPDITTREKGPDIRRIKKTQKWISRYFYQHIYIPLIYLALGLKTRFQDVLFLLFLKRNSVIRYNPPRISDLVIFFAGKLFYVLSRIVVPCMFFPVWKIITLTAIAETFASYWLALIFQISHVVSEVDWPKVDENGQITQDWAELQIQTTMDYATDNWFWNFFTGHLNHQTAHHLFPGINQYYYPQITPIVRRTCEEFGVRYNYKETFSEGLFAHVNHLKRMGQELEARAG